jgi:UDP-N-acetylmuramoyl-tripeptide--D-alanyl-D-alanine ligase
MSTPIPDNRAEMTAWEVAAATGGKLSRLTSEGRAAKGFGSDSRTMRPGNAFVAVAGASFDGHPYVKDAVAKGASLLVVRAGTPLPEAGNVDVVEVPDTLVAWGAIARAHLRRWRRQSRAKSSTIAITGSTGKTTTKELTFALLRTCGECHATLGNLNNRVGVPAVALGVEGSTRFAVFEIGMSEPGEIAALARIVEPEVGVLVNVGSAHAGGVGGTRGDVAREKGALFEELDGATALAVVNLDDEAAAAQVLRTRARVRTFGAGAGADYRLVHRTSLGEAGSRITVERGGERFEAVLPLLGEGAVADFLAALAASEGALGAALAPSVIEQALAECRPVSGRARLKHLGSDILAIDDTYNANPSSMRAALQTLGELGAAGRRKVAILGEMRELGSLAVEEHTALGEALAKAGVALAIGCGGLIDHALQGAANMGVSVSFARSTDDAIEVACREVRPGDVVLFKGSRTIAVERVLGALERMHGAG